MEPRAMNALLIGATGATGKDLLELLLKDTSFQQVDIFVRRPLKIQHPKLNIHVIDFDKPEQWQQLVKGDVLFSALGTTLKAAGSKEAQWKIDYDYQYNVAKAAKENNVNSYLLVSAGFADPKSSVFYSRMKGELEEAIKALGFSKTFFFRPPLLVRKDTDRKGEVIGMKVIQFLNKLGLLHAQKPLPTEVLAQAMINAAKKKESGSTTVESKEIWNYAQRS